MLGNESEPLVWHNSPNFGDKFTLEEFVQACQSGVFVDSDGTGYYAESDRDSNKVARPSDIRAGLVNSSFSHVMWYNK